jgi:hypothetical protein
MQNIPDPTMHAAIASFQFLTTTVATVRTYFVFLPHRTNGALVQSSEADSGYYMYWEKVFLSQTKTHSSPYRKLSIQSISSILL